MTEVILYTAVVGDYDDLKPMKYSPATAFLCNSPRCRKDPQGWKVVSVPLFSTSLSRVNSRVARFYKAMGPVIFPKFKYSVWIDASCHLRRTVGELINLLGDADMAVHRHPNRNCCYAEGSECISQKKDDPDLLRWQLDLYKAIDFPREWGLAQTGLVVRRNNARTRHFSLAWWEQIAMGSCRDQVSLPLAAKQSGVKIAWLPGLFEESAEVKGHCC